jgi:hypothetical protein
MSKISSMAKDHARKNNSLHSDIEMQSYIDGFKAAFTAINEKLHDELDKLEQYPMMGERIFVVKKYQEKILDLLKELETDERF